MSKIKRIPHFIVSIPQSGFLVVKHSCLGSLARLSGRFQSLSRDSWWSNSAEPLTFSMLRTRFQSLSRDSWWSNHGWRTTVPSTPACFNPSVGILGGQTRFVDLHGIPMSKFQSLSRDSWWSNPSLRISTGKRVTSFNPSVGILGGQTPFAFASPTLLVAFQSLSRDSWWSNSPGNSACSWK